VDDSNEILDLNAINPAARKIKIGNPERVVTIQPPETESIMYLFAIAKRMQGASELEPEALGELIKEAKSTITQNIPDIKDERLTFGQLFKLLEILIDMAMPQDSTELDKRQITATDVKKSPSDSSAN
jgi:hypothetical protein